MKEIKFNHLVPELSVSDIKSSLEFYQKVGFRILYERKEDKFAFIELEGNQIMLEEVNGNWNTGELIYPFGRGLNISMTVNNVSQLYQKILDLKIPVFSKLETHSYQVNSTTYEDKEFLIQDPDGYLLRFNN